MERKSQPPYNRLQRKSGVGDEEYSTGDQSHVARSRSTCFAASSPLHHSLPEPRRSSIDSNFGFSRAARSRCVTSPGAAPHFRLLVSGTHTVVWIRLPLSASHCTTMTGLRKPGLHPAGAGRSAHQISPWEITIHFAPERDGPRKPQNRLSYCPVRSKPDSSPR
jgi:hypothetical protein